jgi:hypothetical protein
LPLTFGNSILDMNHFHKLTMISLFSSLLLIPAAIPLLGAQGSWELNFKDHFVSAKFDGVPLETILAEFHKKKGIWYRVDDSVLKKPITAEFTDLSLQDSLRRILLNMNYALTFDSDNRIVGIFVAGKDTGKGGTGWGSYTVAKMNITDEEGLPEEFPNGPSSQASEEFGEEDGIGENPNVSAEQVLEEEEGEEEEEEETPNVEDGSNQELPFLPDDYQIE